MRKKLILTGIILTAITTLTMGLFSFLKANQNDNGKFVTEQAFKANREKQLGMTPQTLDQLRKLGITDDKELKLEYFFSFAFVGVIVPAFVSSRFFLAGAEHHQQTRIKAATPQRICCW